jgi:hypothetical protein
LTAQRQPPTVADATVATQVHESLDIHGQGTTQIAFNRVLGNFTADGLDLNLRQILDLGVRLDAAGVTNFARRGPADTVNGGQRNHRVFLWRNVNPGYTSHEPYLLNETIGSKSRKPAIVPDNISIYNLKTNNLGAIAISALALLVAAILADDAYHTLATDNLAIAANAFY